MTHKSIIFAAFAAMSMFTNATAQDNCSKTQGKSGCCQATEKNSCCQTTGLDKCCNTPALKDFLKGKFSIGTALSASQAAGHLPEITKLVTRHFNCIVAEDCMKSENIHPEKNRYNWTASDSLVMFGEKYGLDVYGHALIWHSQLAPWFPYDDNGKLVSKQEMRKRMKDHIYTVVGRYKGKIKGWDVVNEAIEDDGTFRKSPFYQVLGEEYIALAFQYAHEADPNVELYLNDYNMKDRPKCDAYVKLVNNLKKRGLRIDAIGMQGHMGMDYPSIEEYEKSINDLASTGCKVMITEWEMSALPTIHESANISDKFDYDAAYNPYPNGLPDSVSAVWNQRMKDFFNLFLKHNDVITRVNVWGVGDGDSWKNNFPMKGRMEYPLLFDRQYKMKPFLREIMSEGCNKCNTK